MASATPDIRLPSQPQGITALTLYQIILLGDRGVREQLAQSRYLKVECPGVEPATFCVASQHPNHYITRLHVERSRR